MDPNNYSDELERPISLPELTKSVASQQNNKAAGPDAITNKAWKSAFGALYIHIFILFTSYFCQASIPTQWRDAYINPLYKGTGAKSDPDKFRCITLLNTIYKIYTAILYESLYT